MPGDPILGGSETFPATVITGIAGTGATRNGSEALTYEKNSSPAYWSPGCSQTSDAFPLWM